MLMEGASSREHLSESKRSQSSTCAMFPQPLPCFPKHGECLAEEEEMEENQRQDSVVHLFILEALKLWSANAGKDEKGSFILEYFTHPNFYHSPSHSKCFQKGIPRLGGISGFWVSKSLMAFRDTDDTSKLFQSCSTRALGILEWH